MRHAAIQQQIEKIADLSGVIGCGLVDMNAGLPWCSAGRPDTLAIAESAVNHWRMTLRHVDSHQPLGPVRAQVMVHAHARVTSVTCPPELLLVCVSHEPDTVNWPAWKSQLQALHEVLRAA